MKTDSGTWLDHTEALSGWRLEKGIETGRKETTAAAIRSYVESNYPALLDAPSLSPISSLGSLDDVLKRLYRAKSETAARDILRGH